MKTPTTTTTTTHQPTADSIGKVAEIFEMAAKTDPKGVVDMNSSCWSSCNTPACHGGWFAKMLDPEEVESFADEHNLIFQHYGVGSKMMAKMLGFKEVKDLRMWARNNPKLWGNANGAQMFAKCEAFTINSELNADSNTLTLAVIAKHWRRIATRARRRERLQQQSTN